MDGRDYLGRRISLLNEPAHPRQHQHQHHCLEDDAPSRPARLTSLAFRDTRTSSSSYLDASSPTSSASSPPTPQLFRSDSSDSSAMNRTPSPVTPNFIDYAGLQPSGVGVGVASAKPVADAAFQSPSAFFNPQPDPSVASYPPIPSSHQHHAAHHFTYPAPPALAPQQPQHAHQGLQGLQGSNNTAGNNQGPLDLPHPHHPLAALNSQPQGPPSLSDGASSSTNAKGPAKQQTKKNSYPCPLAKQYNCSDHFTTSGHAARHAKKHTGKKDAFCPECNKAFTRKDNMEQHRRTHQNGRTASKATGENAAKRQKTSKRSSISSAAALHDKVLSAQGLSSSMAAPSMLDPSLPQSPASSFGFPEPAFSSALNPAAMHQYPDPMMQFNSSFAPTSPTMVLDPALGGQLTNGMANGLDTLAMAAAKREDHF